MGHKSITRFRYKTKLTVFPENVRDLLELDPNNRWVIGIFIIKHKLRLSDEELLLSISENY